MDTLKRAAGYIRVSTAEQAEKGQSLQLQRQDIVEYIKRRGWEYHDIYEDAGKSGARIDYRISFQQMTSDAKEGKFNVLVFTTYDRLAEVH